jgi:hypothetical protein
MRLLLGGLRLSAGPFQFTAGGGGGLSSGPGTPEFMVFAGFGMFQPADVLTERLRRTLREEE